VTEQELDTTGGKPLAIEAGRLTLDQLRTIATTEFVPAAYRGNLPAILACVATGRELGLGDMESLRSINVVDGKPSMSADLMVRRVRAAGHSIIGELGESSCTLTGRRVDNDDTFAVTWTLEMAKRAGIVDRPTWKRYPEAMLFNRAVSQLCRVLFADVLGGAVREDDELEDVVETRRLPVVDVVAVDESTGEVVAAGTAAGDASTPPERQPAHTPAATDTPAGELAGGAEIEKGATVSYSQSRPIRRGQAELVDPTITPGRRAHRDHGSGA